MEKATHILFGTLLGFLLYYNGLRPEYAFLSAVASIIPDIDWMIDKTWVSKRSILRRVWKGAFGGRGFHRTILHNLWVLIALDASILIVSGYNYLLLIGFSIGFISHLLLDSLTKTGIYWFWPYGDEKVTGRKRFHIKWRIRTWGLGERLVQSLIVLVLLVVIYFYEGDIRALLDELFRMIK